MGNFDQKKPRFSRGQNFPDPIGLRRLPKVFHKRTNLKVFIGLDTAKLAVRAPFCQGDPPLPGLNLKLHRWGRGSEFAVNGTSSMGGNFV